MSDPETIRIYDARAEDYARTLGSDAPDATLRRFIEALPEAGRVLDLGCGPGRSAHFMAEAGLVVDAWDASAKMVEMAASDRRVTARQAAFDDLDAETIYDGIWANFSLLHAPRDAMPRHLQAIATALKPGGLFHVAVKEGTGEARDKLGRKYSYYTEAALSALLREAGLAPGAFRSGEEKGLDGMMARWISVTAIA